ncbi:MAG: ATP-binding cassette domain-containing protein [Candidatus Nanopelagicales bacterium]
MSQATPALALQDIVKTFGGIQALKGVSLEVHRGEVVALVGDNGAGKSTAIKIVAGVLQPTSGSVDIDGVTRTLSDPEQARHAGIEVVYQDLALAGQQPVYMNMFLGRELVRGPRMLDKARMRAETRTILDSLDVQVPSVDVPVSALSGGQRQGVAIGRATHWSRSLVLMDEPTAALGVAETAKVEQVINRMREADRAILVVSHNLEQVFRISQRIYVLRQGTMIGMRHTAQTSPDEIVGMITGTRE